MIEKRSYPRVRVSQPVLYYPDIYPRPMAATAVDLSLGGTRIETPYSLVGGESLEVNIAIHAQAIKSRGKAIHVFRLANGKIQAGIQFDELSINDKLSLRQYVSNLVQQQARESITIMAVENAHGDQRRHKRVSVDFPVVFETKGIRVLGWSVNASNQGMLVRFQLPLETAVQIVEALRKEQGCRVGLGFTYKRTYRAEAEIRHFHLEPSRGEQCRSLMGFFMPRIEYES